MLENPAHVDSGPFETYNEVMRLLRYLPCYVVLAIAVSCGATVTGQANQEALTKVVDAKLAKDPTNVKLREHLGIQLTRHSLYKKAIEVMRGYTNDLSASGLTALAESYGEEKDFTNQLGTLKILVEKNKENAEYHFLLGHSYLQNAKTSKDKQTRKLVENEAISSFRRSIDIKHNFKPSYEALLNHFIKNDNAYESRIIVRDMIKKFGPSDTLLSHLCRLYAKDSFFEEAETACMKAMRTNSAIAENYLHLALVYEDKGEMQKAERVLKTAAKKFQSSEPAQSMAGEFYRKQKNYSVATRYFTKAVKLDPMSLRAQLGLATSTFELKNYDAALMAFKKVCEIDENRFDEFRESTARLRQQSDYKWTSQYQSALTRCRLPK